MGGDIKLKMSLRGLTALSFKFPVQIIPIEEEKCLNEKFASISSKNSDHKMERMNKCQLILGEERPFPGSISEYLKITKYMEPIANLNYKLSD